jgi:hypothetical protein
MVSTSCQQGWKDGSCCCNCVSNFPLHKHPWNTGEGHGPNDEKMQGFACVLQIDGVKRATYYQHDHGMCEFHDPVPERKEFLKKKKTAERYNV